MRQGLAGGGWLGGSLTGGGEVVELGSGLSSLVLDVLGDGAVGDRVNSS